MQNKGRLFLLVLLSFALLLAVSGSVVWWELGDNRTVAAGIRQANHNGRWVRASPVSNDWYWRQCHR